MTLEVLTVPELRHASEILKDSISCACTGAARNVFLGIFRRYLLELMMSVKADIAVAEHRSDFDPEAPMNHKRVRRLKPQVGGGQVQAKPFDRSLSSQKPSDISDTSSPTTYEPDHRS
jgi:hypothetical protein